MLLAVTWSGGGIMGVFESRQEMVEVYDALMAQTTSALREYRRYEYGRYPLKSYMVEVDVRPGVAPRDSLTQMLEDAGLGESSEVSKTDDDHLYSVLAGDFHAMFDNLDDRFWLVHTVGSAEDADRFVFEALTQTARADSMWLTSDFLRGVLRAGVPHGFSTAFDTDYFAHKPRTETLVGLRDAIKEPDVLDADQQPAGDGDNETWEPIQTLNIHMWDSSRDGAGGARGF